MAGVCSPQLLPLPYDTSSASGAPLLPFSFEELALERGLRSVTVFDDKLVSREASSDATPPGSPLRHTPSSHSTPPLAGLAGQSTRPRNVDSDQERAEQESGTEYTPPHALNRPGASYSTPEKPQPPQASTSTSALVTPPTPPRSRTKSHSSEASPDSPGLLARRAAAGKLPNKALVSLQQMRFGTKDGGMGLGLGPGSAGFESLEGISPGLPRVSSGSPGLQGGAGMAFRLALGLDGGKEEDDLHSRDSREDDENSNWPSPPQSVLASPTLIRQTSLSNRRRLLSLGPGAATPSSPEMVKIPPSLRGSKILDKLNLSASPQLSSPRDRTTYANSPPSPVIIRSSAFSYINTGPLTPLTPSHIPGAPLLSSGGSTFEWCSYSQPDSPTCPVAPIRSVFLEDDVSPRQPFFLPTPPSESVRPSLSRSPIPGSPLADRSRLSDPFFSPPS